MAGCDVTQCIATPQLRWVVESRALVSQWHSFFQKAHKPSAQAERWGGGDPAELLGCVISSAYAALLLMRQHVAGGFVGSSEAVVRGLSSAQKGSKQDSN
ncbi:hypothetical protein CIRG_00819 [Coccidioides immitis RMSCC 2394]|uniref:Uncharacterized protein n=1 Tax=Coccidioides immitis RMSCC 2394 TaxID=404692 RepID=A0A0J7ATQ5_COCIT|nr:hypothetical protein CIRG_00819 [Coccidioides immitis RMSCC 2394]